MDHTYFAVNKKYYFIMSAADFPFIGILFANC